MLSEKQIETLETLSTLRKQIELLDSHKTMEMIKPKQYNQALAIIAAKVEAIEKEYGLEPYIFSEEDLIFKNYDSLFK